MLFRITHHAGYNAPPDALDMLLLRLGPEQDDVSFAKVESEIHATWNVDAPMSRTRDEHAEIGRRVVFDIVRETCEISPELVTDWYAVSKLPDVPGRREW